MACSNAGIAASACWYCDRIWEHFGLRHDAGLEAQVEDPRGLAEISRRRLRDLELPVERAQRDVAGRDARDHRQHDAALRLLAGVDLRLRGLGQAAHAAEEVELP